jgi:uncharacterized protein with FMN-binding domain
MNHTNLKRTILPLAMTVVAGFPIGNAWAASTHSAARAARTQAFKGPTIDAMYGPVQVSIGVKSKKITTIKVANSPDSARGQFLQGQAIPLLKQETLTAQSAKVSVVSGATQTSEAYIQSLQSAIKKAKAVKALK